MDLCNVLARGANTLARCVKQSHLLRLLLKLSAILPPTKRTMAIVN